MDTRPGETDPPESPWWQALPPAEATIQCGEQQHVIRWADGSLAPLAHPDLEAELVLAALGGDSARDCLEVVRMWGRHDVDDLDVLILGPRTAADRVMFSWDDLGAQRQTRHRGTAGRSGRAAGPGPLPHRPTHRLMDQGGSRIELFSLLALGTPFQIRLVGAVAAGLGAQPRAGERAAIRPRLTAALAGRLAPAAGEWAGIDPDQVNVAVHEGPGWGSLKVTGTGDDRSLRASLPLTWLARVWACGLAVTGGHLVIDVRTARWPDAEVIALPAPGAEPTILRLHGRPPAGEAGAAPRWEVAGLGDAGATT